MGIGAEGTSVRRKINLKYFTGTVVSLFTYMLAYGYGYINITALVLPYRTG
jgi:hypothetical protein